MIQFKTIKWRNFLSTGNAYTEIALDAHPTTLILGENGSGKSTLLDAICFALFSRPYRNINKPQLVNSINNKNCVVEIDFTIGTKDYKIVRGIKPAIFEIWLNGKLLNQDAASRDYQKYLEEAILKLNFKSFTQIVILGSASFTPFMQLPAANRREVIEDILDIKIFTAMNTVLKSKMATMKEDLNGIEGKLKVARTRAEVQQSYVKTLREDRQHRITELEAMIDKALNDNAVHQKKIDHFEEQVRLVNEEVTDDDSLAAKIDNLAKEIHHLHIKEVDLKHDVAFYLENETCPKCLQVIEEQFKLPIIEDHQKRLGKTKDAEAAAMEELGQLEKQLQRIKTAQMVIRDFQNTISTVQNEMQANHRYIQRLELERADLSQKVGNIQTEKQKLKDIASEALEVAKQRTELHEAQHYHEIAGVLLKDTGIKTRIIRQYLPVINKLVNKFLTMMDFFVQFTLDERFEESIKSRYRDEFSYESFSEGEKQRIDLALLFTWRTIAKLKNSASTNLLILDEVFDSSLDNSATDQVMALLNTLGEGTNVWVISHKGDTFSDKFNHTLRFVKKNNFSVIG